MTAQEYKSNGYKVSAALDQSVIDRVESEVKASYIVPVTGAEFDATDTNQLACLYAFAFIGICREQVFGTRSGGVRKNTTESERTDLEVVLQRTAGNAHRLLSTLGDYRKAVDIYGIYLTTNFFNI